MKLTLNNDVEVPALGLGVFQTPPDETRAAVNAALVFDFDLTDAELAAIDDLDTDQRGGPEPTDITLESFGRPIPEA